jgi:hypothetical protein
MSDLSMSHADTKLTPAGRQLLVRRAVLLSFELIGILLTTDANFGSDNVPTIPEVARRVERRRPRVGDTRATDAF